MDEMIIKVEFLTGVRILQEGVTNGIAVARLFPPGDWTRRYAIRRAQDCARAMRQQFGRSEATRILRKALIYHRAYEQPAA